MNKIQYKIHLLLQSKYLSFFFLSCLILFFNILNITALCEVDNDNVIKNEVVKEDVDTTVALTLFVISILFSIYILPFALDGTLFERITEALNEKPYVETYEPANPQDVMDWAEEWLKKELGFEGKSNAEICKILFGNKKK